MTNVAYTEFAKQAHEKMTHGGIFLVTGEQTPNVMTIGWGGINFYWGKPLFIVPVRYSRYSYQLLEAVPEFSVCVPLEKKLAKELAFCGTRSGRDINKFEALGLTPQPAKTIRPPVIGECDLIYECRTIYRQTLDPAGFLDKQPRQYAYDEGDFHTLFYGEITACYLNK